LIRYGWLVPFPGALSSPERMVLWSVGSTAYLGVTAGLLVMMLWGGVHRAPELNAVGEAIVEQEAAVGCGCSLLIVAILVFALPVHAGLPVAAIVLYALIRGMLAIKLWLRPLLLYPALLIVSFLLLPVDGASHAAMPLAGVGSLAWGLFARNSALPLLAASGVLAL
jgi:hypothetical protein